MSKRKYSIHKYLFFMFELHIKFPHTTTTHKKNQHKSSLKRNMPPSEMLKYKIVKTKPLGKRVFN